MIMTISLFFPTQKEDSTEDEDENEEDKEGEEDEEEEGDISDENDPLEENGDANLPVPEAEVSKENKRGKELFLFYKCTNCMKMLVHINLQYQSKVWTHLHI